MGITGLLDYIHTRGQLNQPSRIQSAEAQHISKTHLAALQHGNRRAHILQPRGERWKTQRRSVRP